MIYIVFAAAQTPRQMASLPDSVKQVLFGTEKTQMRLGDAVELVETDIKFEVKIAPVSGGDPADANVKLTFRIG